MSRFTTAVSVVALSGVLGMWKAAPADAENNVEISTDEQRPAAPGPEATFTGAVTVQPLFDPNGVRDFGSAEVSFTPCARTAWHSHPAGQTLVVTAGTGWVQEWGGVKQQMKPGDVVWTPPGVKHWHGATPDGAMTHIAIQGVVAGSPVDWMEHVTDQEYLA